MQGQSSALDPGISPEPVTHLPQSRLLPLLLDGVGGAATVRFGARVDEVVHDAGNAVTVRGGAADGSTWRLSCDYLVAADGANSRTRCACLRARRSPYYTLSARVATE